MARTHAHRPIAHINDSGFIERQEDYSHFSRYSGQQFAERRQNRERRHADRAVMRRINCDPEFYDEAVFAQHRRDSWEWC